MFFVFFLPYIGEYLITWFFGINPIISLKLLLNESHIALIEKKLKKGKLKENKKKVVEAKLSKAKKNHAKYEEKYKTVHEKLEKRRENPYKLKVEKNDAVLWLILVFIICAFTGLLTPLKDTPYTYLINTMEGNTTNSIQEHQPLQLIDNKNLMAVLAVIFAILIFTDTKIKLRDVFMFAGLLFMCFMSRRQVSLFVLICVFVAEKLIVYLIDKYGTLGLDKVLRICNSIVGKILILLIVCGISYSIYKPVRNYPYINSSTYPVEACDYILENMDYKNMHLYNEYNYGSYLIFRGIPVFIDSRADLYAPEFNRTIDALGTETKRDIFSDYINTSTISAYYEDMFNKYNIDHVLCYRSSKLNMLIKRDKNYKQLYEDSKFVIYERLNAQKEDSNE